MTLNQSARTWSPYLKDSPVCLGEFPAGWNSFPGYQCHSTERQSDSSACRNNFSCGKWLLELRDME